MREALAWYIVVQVAALAVWPVVARALAPLEDRGWAATKAAGVLSVAWLAWLICMLAPIPFTRLTLALVLLVIVVAVWSFQLRTEGVEPVRLWLRAKRDLLLVWESLFLAAFVLFALLRAHEPDIAAFEKPMDMAFVNGFITAQRLPTQDTWLAGFGEPYYYFGYFLSACLGKLSGVTPGIAYNLAGATIPALTVVAFASLAWSLARAAGVQPVWSAAGTVAGTLLALFCGNLSTFFEFLVSRGWLSPSAGDALGIKRFADGITPGVWPPTAGLWWFKASRVIPNTQPDGINEFPFFTALLTDLHPHFVAMPFELLVLALATTHVLTRGATLRSAWTQGLAALTLGGLLVINTWDIAPFWLIYIGLSLYAARFCDWPGASAENPSGCTGPRRRQSDEARPTANGTEGVLLGRAWGRWAAAVATPFVGAVLFVPYFVGYGGPPLGLGVVADRTPLGSLLVLFGWAIALLAALGLFTRWCIGDRRGWSVVGVGAVVGVVLAILGQPGLGLLVGLLATLLPWPGVIDRFDPASATVVGIAAFAVAILLGCELIFLNDVFHSRMNTVFKFHENAWLLAGLASGIGLALVGRFTRRARWVIAAVAAVFIAGGLVYPLSAIATRMAEMPPGGPTLDGFMFLSPDDRAAVRWLSDQNAAIGGRVVIAEGLGDEYNPAAAGMASYSGAATVLGWAGHELQWRGPIPEIGDRQGDLAGLYRDLPVDQIRTILDRYGVQFVVVGDVERKTYGDGVTTRFDNVLPVAFRAGPTVIYRAR